MRLRDKRYLTLIATNLSRGLLFVVLFVVTYMSALYLVISNGVLTEYVPNVKSTRGGVSYSLVKLHDFTTADNSEYDALFVGSSLFDRGLDPRVFSQRGLNTFNLSTSAQTPFNSNYLMKRYVDMQKVELVVLDAYWYLFGDTFGGAESAIDFFSNTQPDLGQDLALATKINIPLVYNSLFANRLWQMFDPVDVIEQKPTDDRQYTVDGHVEVTRKSKVAKVLAKLGEPTDFVVSARKIEQLRDNITHILDSDTKVVLVSLPVTKQYLNTVKNYQEISRQFKEIANEYSINYYDFNLERGLLDKDLVLKRHYYDRNHLNAVGSEIMSRSLYNILSKDEVI